MGERLIQGYKFDLSGRTVLITGASSGIGKRFARIVSECGANVVLAARRVSLLESLQKDIENEGGHALAVAMDVTDEASTKAAYDAAEAKFGVVDSIVSNAGISIPGSALRMDVDDFDKTVSVNLRGVFLTVREGVRRMTASGPVENGRGRVVIVSSVTAEHAPIGAAAYSSTKAASMQIGRAFAKDWARKGVNVNVIAPGYISTEMTDDLWKTETGQNILNAFPRRRLMDISALDAMLLYLCSDASAPVTGSVFTIDDGQTL
ncbi:MAG: short-chain dehydrogenase [Alphaproteobacteria bacterium]|nr:MAG: short-chain dehydrogenase [Alphaproteobacteria bacterium]